MSLAAKVNDPGLAGSVPPWRLIYGDGSTTSSSLRLSRKDANGNTVAKETYDLKHKNTTASGMTGTAGNGIELTPGEPKFDSATNTYSRSATITPTGTQDKLTLTQTVSVGPKTDNDQFYTVS